MVNLKGILTSSEKKKEKELYWAVVIEPGWVQAGIWRIDERSAQVLLTSPPTAWELDDELVQTVDSALSASIQNLPEDVAEPSRTVFGVLSSWVEKGEIKEKHLGSIKRICSDLSLEPTGFVVLPEAIAHFFKSKEGSPLSAVILGVSEQNLELAVFKLGNLVGTADVARSVSVADDVIEGLARFSGVDSIPSRFIIHDGREGELEDTRQALLKADWDAENKFKLLHTPKVEIMSGEEKVSAVSLAGASELADVTAVAFLKKEEEETDELDIRGGLANIEDAGDDVSPADLGFVLGKDIAEKKEREAKGEELKEEEKDDAKVYEEPEEKIPPSRKILSLPKARLKFGFFKKFFAWLKGTIPSKTPSLALTAGKKTFVIGVFTLLLVLAGGFSAYWFLPKATVVLYVSTQRLDEKITIKIDPQTSSPDFEERILPGEVLEESQTGDKTKVATGAKTVGEKATGDVTLYRVGTVLNLTSGTELTGPGGLKFTLDEDVGLASGSASSPSSKNAKVTASDIGAQYNIAADSSFAVGNYTTADIEAKNSSAFSGGTSREISAVSQKDLDQLEDDLSDELLEKAKSSMKEKLNTGKIFIEEATSFEIAKKTYSGRVGDEATNVKLTLSLDVVGVSVDKDSLNKFARDVLESKVPEGFVLRDEQIEMSFEFEGEEKGRYVLVTDVKANLLPEIDPDSIAENIVGKYPDIARDYLTKNVPGFVRANIVFKPKLPGKLGTLPRLKKNVEVEVGAER